MTSSKSMIKDEEKTIVDKFFNDIKDLGFSKQADIAGYLGGQAESLCRSEGGFPCTFQFIKYMIEGSMCSLVEPINKYIENIIEKGDSEEIYGDIRFSADIKNIKTYNTSDCYNLKLNDNASGQTIYVKYEKNSFNTKVEITKNGKRADYQNDIENFVIKYEIEHYKDDKLRISCENSWNFMFIQNVEHAGQLLSMISNEIDYTVKQQQEEAERKAEMERKNQPEWSSYRNIINWLESAYILKVGFADVKHTLSTSENTVFEISNPLIDSKFTKESLSQSVIGKDDDGNATLTIYCYDADKEEYNKLHTLHRMKLVMG